MRSRDCNGVHAGRQIGTYLAALCLVLTVSSSSSGQESSRQIIENRIAGFRDMGSAFKNLGDELKSGQPNSEKVKASAKVIQSYSMGVPSWFPAGSEPPPEVPRTWSEWFSSWFSSGDNYQVPRAENSRAKLEIWKRPAEFEQAYQHLQTEADAMLRASESGDVPAVTAQFQKLEGACNSCHRVFREETP